MNLVERMRERERDRERERQRERQRERDRETVSYTCPERMRYWLSAEMFSGGSPSAFHCL